MDFEAAKKRTSQLRKEIKYHSKLYYEQDSPEISDQAFDRLMNELKDLEEQFPELRTKSSPTQHVGGKAGRAFQKVTHKVPLLLSRMSSQRKKCPTGGIPAAAISVMLRQKSTVFLLPLLSEWKICRRRNAGRWLCR